MRCQDVWALAEGPVANVSLLTTGTPGIGGANIGQMASFPNSDVAAEGSRMTHLACDSMRRMPVPVIARINGYCLGTGMEIAASCRLSSRRCAVTVMTFKPPRSSAVSLASFWSGVWVSAVWALAAWLMNISGNAVVARRRIGIWISRSVARFFRWASKRARSHSADNQSNFLFLLFWINDIDERMRLDNFDLNLLIAFDILVEERSVTRAATRLSIGQSAMSSTLGRLRKLFADPILVRDGRTMVATPVAEGAVHHAFVVVEHSQVPDLVGQPACRGFVVVVRDAHELARSPHQREPAALRPLACDEPPYVHPARQAAAPVSRCRSRRPA